MFTWLGFALQLLKLVNSIMLYAKERELISEGYDKAIAEVTAQILMKTEAGKKIMERVNGMSAEEIDAGLRSLEPSELHAYDAGRLVLQRLQSRGRS